MNRLTVKGNQNFMGKDIPVVSGGFGQGKKCMSDKTIAEIHGMEVKHVRELINRNIKRFANGIDTIDLKVVVQNDDNLLSQLGYSQMQISKAEHIYILSERGYSKLIKIMDTDLAWEIHDKLMDEYFEMREEKQTALNISNLSPQLQMFIQLETAQKEQAVEIQTIKKDVQLVKEQIETKKQCKLAPVQTELTFEAEVYNRTMHKDRISTERIGAMYLLSPTAFYDVLYKLGLVVPATRKGWLLHPDYENKGIGFNNKSNEYFCVAWSEKGLNLIKSTLKDNGVLPVKRLPSKKRRKTRR